MGALHWKQHDKETVPWQSVRGLHCYISLESRPSYCDRGNFIAKLFVDADAHPMKLFIDEADGWPRYYFDKARAKLEIEAWLIKRKELPQKSPAG